MTSNRDGEGEGDEAATNGQGSLFKGMSFWLSRNVPQRIRFRDLIQQNGGVVRLQEKDADILIVDHKRKNLQSNVYSYQFIEKSIQNGVLQDLDNYKAGPSPARPVGATNIPTRRHRLAYTLEDDQILWDYMQQFEKDPAAPIRGNKFYQDLAAKIPRHTYQSWRDRYLKRLQGRPRPGGNAEPTATRAANEEVHREARSRALTRPDKNDNRRSESPQQPQEKKRKRSPEPITASHRTSNGMTSAQIINPAQEKSLQIQVLSELPLQRESSRHETPSSPKKAKTAAPPSTEKGIPSEVTDTDSTSINDLLIELPFFEPEQESENEEPEQDIDAWIEDRLGRGKGDEAQILEALQCTSMDPDLADTVLESLVAGKGIPTNMRGVWTAEDDSCIDAQDSRAIQRVFDKHGSDLFNARWEYLGLARADM
ncbi:TRF2-interacting telomeric protein/Rap1 C terminal domain-containing protein [Aspergillus granulosus]|uniref:DNA-binding protein RAP1 n=1 Tax=Aspergillus granulosus TaxID=176169 RepID=A0ABR4I2S2_9EURO